MARPMPFDAPVMITFFDANSDMFTPIGYGSHRTNSSYSLNAEGAGHGPAPTSFSRIPVLLLEACNCLIERIVSLEDRRQLRDHENLLNVLR